MITPPTKKTFRLSIAVTLLSACAAFFFPSFAYPLALAGWGILLAGNLMEGV